VAACQVKNQLLQCKWPVISNPADIKKIMITTRITEAGTWINRCLVTARDDSNPSNNMANATVIARVSMHYQ
jgi:hypothetical protein